MDDGFSLTNRRSVIRETFAWGAKTDILVCN